MKNILITGGAGYIGSHVVEAFLNKNFNVIVVDNLSTGYRKLVNNKAVFFKGDINQFKFIRGIILKNNIDTIVHLAAKILVEESEKKPKIYYKNNSQGTLNLLRACKNTTVKNFCFSSTAAVYGDKVKMAKESSKISPKNVYGKTKVKAENYVKSLFKNKNFCILRYFNVVGAMPEKNIGQITKTNHIFKKFPSIAIKKKPILYINGYDYKTKDGTCVRDYIHVRDLADLHLKILLKVNSTNKSIVLNCGYGKGFSVKEVAERFKEIINKNIKIQYKDRRIGDMEEIVADVKKLNLYLKWKPKFNNLDKIITNCIEWEKKLKKIY